MPALFRCGAKYNAAVRIRPVLLLAAVLLAGMSLAGCVVRFGGGPTGEFSPVKPGVLTVTTERVPLAGFWLGTRQNPTGGFEHELAVAIAGQLGLDRVEIRTVPFERIIAGDLDGADLALRELTPTPEREQNLDFSTPYLSAPPAALVPSGEVIPDLKTAKGLTWAVPAGTTLVDTVESVIAPDQVRIGPTRGAVIRLVAGGKADAALFDLPVAMAVAHASNGRFDVAAQFKSDETLAAALPKDSSGLEAVNSAIRTLTADGTISALAERWLGESLQAGSFTVPGIPLIR